MVPVIPKAIFDYIYYTNNFIVYIENVFLKREYKYNLGRYSYLPDFRDLRLTFKTTKVDQRH